MRKIRPIYIILLFVLVIASGIYTYNNLHIGSLILFYIIDAIILVLLLLIMLGVIGNKKIKVTHDDYQHWITEGSVEKNNRLVINIFTLDDLVQLAIDSDKRVIHDPKQGKYFVFAEDVAYVFDPAYVNGVKDNRNQIGRILLDKGIIQTEQLETGLYYQKRVGSRLGDSLIALGFIDEAILSSILAAQQNMAFYELDENKEIEDTSWLSIMSTSRARALQVLPLGHRSDGKLVIACGETALKGLNDALQEIFGKEIYLVAARPSHIIKILENLEKKEQKMKQVSSYQEFLRERKAESLERLTDDESEHFIKSYLKGKLDMFLFIKACGMAHPSILTQVPDPELIINFLIGKGNLSGETTNLITALGRLVKKQDNKSRQEKIIPGILDLLIEAFYITPEAAEWAKSEADAQSKQLRTLLEENYLVSSETVEQAAFILKAFKNLVSEVKVY